MLVIITLFFVLQGVPPSLVSVGSSLPHSTTTTPCTPALALKAFQQRHLLLLVAALHQHQPLLRDDLNARRRGAAVSAASSGLAAASQAACRSGFDVGVSSIRRSSSCFFVWARAASGSMPRSRPSSRRHYCLSCEPHRIAITAVRSSAIPFGGVTATALSPCRLRAFLHPSQQAYSATKTSTLAPLASPRPQRTHQGPAQFRRNVCSGQIELNSPIPTTHHARECNFALLPNRQIAPSWAAVTFP